MTGGDASTFESTDGYDAAYRRGYGEDVIECLVDRFGVDESCFRLDREWSMNLLVGYEFSRWCCSPD